MKKKKQFVKPSMRLMSMPGLNVLTSSGSTPSTSNNPINASTEGLTQQSFEW